jgi:hypothetical protein
MVSGPLVLWVKPESRPWQKFYLDAGFSGWEELAEADAFLGFDEPDELHEVTESHGLVGKTLGSVEAFDDAGEWGLRIHLADRVIELAPEDPSDLESGARLAIRVSRTEIP